MYWHRLTLTGPAPDVAALSAHLHTVGAAPTIDGAVIWRHREGLPALTALSKAHPRVAIGSESFEELGDDMICAVTREAETTVMDVRPALDPDGGGYFEEDGAPLDPGVLRAAAASIAGPPPDTGEHTFACGLDTALLMAKELAGFAQTVGDPWSPGAPPPGALAAVVRLARIAAVVAGSPRGGSQAELGFDQAWRLARMTARAGAHELWDEPGRADWLEWLSLVLECAAAVTGAAAECRVEAEHPWHAIAEEHHRQPEDFLEMEADGLLVTCLQVLALFGNVHAE